MGYGSNQGKSGRERLKRQGGGQTHVKKRLYLALNRQSRMVSINLDNETEFFQAIFTFVLSDHKCNSHRPIYVYCTKLREF